uniref:NADH-ubiquinone oxidoreductase chain 4 n=1 Tax=Laelaps nuttalli TaxID=2902835 RepID=A0AAU6QE24_9ACAR
MTEMSMLFFMLLLSYKNIFLSIFMIMFNLIYYFLSSYNLNLFLNKNFLLMDEISFLMIILSLWILILMLLCSNFSLNKNFMFLFLLSNLLMSFLSSNMIFFYIFFEITLIPMTLIIFFWGGQIERMQAGIYMFTYTIFGSMPLLLMIFYLNNSFNLSFKFLQFFNINLNIIMTIFLFLGFFIKLPMYFFHLWLPKAHVEAPVTGSMILAGVMLKLGGYGLYRSLMFMNWSSLIILEKFLFSISLISGIIISLICLAQIDLKIMIAYSSVCHMSLIISGLFSGNFWGENGFILLMLSHGICSSGLFCLANMYYERFFSRNLLLLKGMSQIFPFLGFFWFILCSFNMSAPPSMNLFSEILTIGGILKFNIMCFPFIIAISFFSGFYCIILFLFIQHGKFSYLKSSFLIKINEFTLSFLHTFPLIIYIFNMNILLTI